MISVFRTGHESYLIYPCGCVCMPVAHVKHTNLLLTLFVAHPCLHEEQVYLKLEHEQII